MHELFYYYYLLWSFFVFFPKLFFFFPKDCIFLRSGGRKEAFSEKCSVISGVLQSLVKICQKYMEVNLFLLLSCTTLILKYSWRMHSLPQFTRSTRWGEFAWVGANIFEENFMVSEQFSGGHFSSGAIVRGAIFLGDNCPGGNFP